MFAECFFDTRMTLASVLDTGRHNKVFLASLFVHNKENMVSMNTIVGTIEHYKTLTAHCWMMIMLVMTMMLMNDDDDDANE